MSATRTPNPKAAAGKAKQNSGQPKSASYIAKRRALSERLKALRSESEALAIDAGMLLDRLTN